MTTAAQGSLTTHAEKTGWTKTGRYEEVERLCSAFQKKYPKKVKCVRFGTSPENRPMLALIASTDGLWDPKRVKAKKRPVVFFQGGIHSGETQAATARERSWPL